MAMVTVNGRPHEAANAETVRDLLERIGYDKRPVIVERNGNPLEAADLEHTLLEDGDRLEVVQLVGGG